MNKTWLTTSGLVIALVLLFGVNLLSNGLFTSSRLDLTDKQLYTLSSGTQNILASLEEPITLRLFVSQQELTRLPGLGSYATRVRNLMEEYARKSNGKLTLKVIDPEPFSEEEDRAVGYGIQGIPLEDGSSQIYFGAVGTNSTDQQEVIPFFAADRQEFLEYDLSKLVSTLATLKKPVVGLISTLPLTGSAGIMPGAQPQPAWVVAEQLQQLFEVRDLGMSATEIDDDVAVLVVVHPQNMSDALTYAIDQYVLRGGNLVLFVDPNAEAQPPVPGMPQAPDTSSHLNRLTRNWGVEMVEGKVVGDLARALRVRTSPQFGSAVVDYPIWMELQQTELDNDDVITSQLGNITLGSPGQLNIIEGSDTEVIPLIETTADAMVFDAGEVGFDTDPQELLRKYAPGQQAIVVGARIRGNVKTAFEAGPPEDDETEGAEQDSADSDAGDGSNEEAADADNPSAHLVESETAINVIVIADTDLLQDRFWVSVQNLLGQRVAVPNAGNGALVVNAVDNLSGSSDLISVRSRGEFARPFTLVQSLRQQAEIKFRKKEQELMTQLESTEAKLLELEQARQSSDTDTLLLSDAQRQEIEKFRSQRVQVRKDLRDVRSELRKDINRVEGWAKFANIGLMPLIIGIGGLVVGLWQMRRRDRTRSIKRQGGDNENS